MGFHLQNVLKTSVLNAKTPVLNPKTPVLKHLRLIVYFLLCKFVRQNDRISNITYMDEKVPPHIFGQVCDQVFGQGFDQGFEEGESHKYSVQYCPGR